MPSRRRSYLLVPLFIVLCSFAAGIFGGRNVSAASPAEARNLLLALFTCLVLPLFASSCAVS